MHFNMVSKAMEPLRHRLYEPEPEPIRQPEPEPDTYYFFDEYAVRRYELQAEREQILQEIAAMTRAATLRSLFRGAQGTILGQAELNHIRSFLWGA